MREARAGTIVTSQRPAWSRHLSHEPLLLAIHLGKIEFALNNLEPRSACLPNPSILSPNRAQCSGDGAGPFTRGWGWGAEDQRTQSCSTPRVTSRQSGSGQTHRKTLFRCRLRSCLSTGLDAQKVRSHLGTRRCAVLLCAVVCCAVVWCAVLCCPSQTLSFQLLLTSKCPVTD